MAQKICKGPQAIFSLVPLRDIARRDIVSRREGEKGKSRSQVRSHRASWAVIRILIDYCNIKGSHR